MSRITDIHLERYLAGILSASETRQLEALIKTDSELSSRVDALRRSSEEFLAETSPELFARRLQGRLEMQEQGTRSWMDGLQRLSLTFAMLFVCVAVYWFTEGSGPMESSSLSRSVETSMPAKMAAPSAVHPAQEKTTATASDIETGTKPESKESGRLRVQRGPDQAPPAMSPKRRAKREAKQRKAVQSETPSRKSAQDAVPDLQFQARSETSELVKKPQARRATPSSAPRMFMRKFAPKPVQLRLKGPNGDLRVPGNPIKLGSDETLVVSAVPGSQFYWSYALASKSKLGSKVGPTDPSLYSGSAAQLDVGDASGPTDVWVFYSDQTFTVESILFDGLAYRSQDEKIRIMRFSAIFLK